MVICGIFGMTINFPLDKDLSANTYFNHIQISWGLLKYTIHRNYVILTICKKDYLADLRRLRGND